MLERRTFNNVTTNGETEFDNVVKKLLPDLLGTPLGELLPGQAVDVPLSYTFPAVNTVETPDSLFVVVLVQDAQTREVLQSAVGQVNGVLGIAEVAAPVEAVLRLAPNPAISGRATAYLTLPVAAPVGVRVVDALGRVVVSRPPTPLAAGAHALPLDLRGAASGLYVVRLTVGERSLTRRLRGGREVRPRAVTYPQNSYLSGPNPVSRPFGPTYRVWPAMFYATPHQPTRLSFSS